MHSSCYQFKVQLLLEAICNLVATLKLFKCTRYIASHCIDSLSTLEYSCCLKLFKCTRYIDSLTTVELLEAICNPVLQLDFA